MPSPRADRPHMPGGYLAGATSAPGERMPWRRVEELLVTSRNYWVCTTRPDGRPHTAPVWGVWLYARFLFSTGRGSRKAKNIAKNPNVAVHVEAIGEAVTIEGRAEEIDDDAALSRFVEAYNPKYSWDFTLESLRSLGVVYDVRPRVCLSFTEDLAETATRWTFD